MNSKISAAKARNITLLAALLSSPAVIAADRLDDWSSPRPIKYAASSSYSAQTQSPLPGAAAPREGSSEHSQAAALLSESTIVPRPPEPPLSTESVVDAAATPVAQRGLFPAAEPMRPEHVGILTSPVAVSTPTNDPARDGNAYPYRNPATTTPAVRRDRIAASSMHLAAAQRPEPTYAAEPANAAPVERASQSVLDVASLQGQTPTGYQPMDAMPPSLQLQPAMPPARSTSTSQTVAVEQPLLPVPNVGTKTVSNWQLGRLASQKIAQAEELLSRQSPMAARQQAIEALHLIAQSTDETTRSSEGTEALTQALTAIREASDFLGRFGVVDATAMQRLVDSHSTLVLKRCDLEQVTPLRAADVYYEFARGRFVDAVAGWAPASRALIIVAKTEPLTADVGDSNLSAAQVCCLRSAIACDPDNAVAANELGHELLALGMFDEARWALEHSYAKQPSTAALQNLAELHRVTGNMELAQACATNLALLQSQQPRVAQVVQLTPSQFAQMSPQVMSPGTPQVAAAGEPPVSPHVQQTNPEPQQQGRVASTFDRVKGIFR
ncbi:hypothetical protein EC9_21150 [Rosistilla ulvae]|uniref:Tetratricopeptide repeat protein n=1 Tax=Rosistilla ulvae TaxID=1930277 RepID=A0A517LZ85_9BACT|nr:hypothetical protein [Rosistilla ulvae]QDS87932.1 hypothetical protein EC9_21150 [Rosistilla ulvae]